MSLLGTMIDSRTLAGLTSAQSTSFAHGLGTTPDYVGVQYIASLATSNTLASIAALADASNVTLSNVGNATSPTLQVVSFRLHSLIR